MTGIVAWGWYEEVCSVSVYAALIPWIKMVYFERLLPASSSDYLLLER